VCVPVQPTIFWIPSPHNVFIGNQAIGAYDSGVRHLTTHTQRTQAPLYCYPCAWMHRLIYTYTHNTRAHIHVRTGWLLGVRQRRSHRGPRAAGGEPLRQPVRAIRCLPQVSEPRRLGDDGVVCMPWLPRAVAYISGTKVV
jgi:hypothetical protein